MAASTRVASEGRLTAPIGCIKHKVVFEKTATHENGGVTPCKVLPVMHDTGGISHVKNIISEH